MKSTVHTAALVSHSEATPIHSTVVQHNLAVSHTLDHVATAPAKPSSAPPAPNLALPDVPDHRTAPSSTEQSPTDAPKGQGHEVSVHLNPLDGLKLPGAEAREQLLASLHRDPVHHDDAGSGTTRPSGEELRANAGVGSHDDEAKHQDAAANLIAHEQAAEDQAGNMVGRWLNNDAYDDALSNKELGADGNWHFTVRNFSDQGIIKSFTFVQDGTNVTLEYTSIFDANNHTTTYVYPDGSTKTYKNGELVDETKALEQPSHTPDTDHPTHLPSLGEVLDQLNHEHHSHDPRVTDSAGDDTGTITDVSVSGPITEHTVQYSPADPAGPSSGVGGDGRVINGSPGEVGPNSGNGNVIHDLDQGTQSTGPEERNTQHEIPHEAPAAANSQGSDNQASGSEHAALNFHGDVLVFADLPVTEAVHTQLDPHVEPSRHNESHGSAEPTPIPVHDIVPDHHLVPVHAHIELH